MKRKVATTKRKSTKKATTTKRKKATATRKKTVARKTTARKSTKKYGKGSQKEVEKEMRKFKRGTAKSGRAGTPVESREQAIAIGLSKARKKGIKVPKKRS